eukprot:752734-Hanusia_phi.AAC.2
MNIVSSCLATPPPPPPALISFVLFCLLAHHFWQSPLRPGAQHKQSPSHVCVCITEVMVQKLEHVALESLDSLQLPHRRAGNGRRGPARGEEYHLGAQGERRRRRRRRNEDEVGGIVRGGRGAEEEEEGKELIGAACHLHGVRDELAKNVQDHQVARRLQVLLARSSVTPPQDIPIVSFNVFCGRFALLTSHLTSRAVARSSMKVPGEV